MSEIKTTRRLMDTRTGDNAHKGPEELEPGLLLAPGMVAKEVLDVVKTTETGPGDVFIASNPKSGMTWLQQTIKLFMNNGELRRDWGRCRRTLPLARNAYSSRDKGISHCSHFIPVNHP